MDHLGFDPSTSSLRRTRASDCANNPWWQLTRTHTRKKQNCKFAKKKKIVWGFVRGTQIAAMLLFLFLLTGLVESKKLCRPPILGGSR